MRSRTVAKRHTIYLLLYTIFLYSRCCYFVAGEIPRDTRNCFLTFPSVGRTKKNTRLLIVKCRPWETACIQVIQRNRSNSRNTYHAPTSDNNNGWRIRNIDFPFLFFRIRSSTTGIQHTRLNV